LYRFLLKYRNAILVGGVLLLILGLRIVVGIRFVLQIPQADDFSTVNWLQQWSLGVHDWAFIWQRHNGHPMVLYYLANLGQFLLNGYWDARLDFLVYALIHTAYAALVIFTFRNLLTPGDRGWLLTLIFGLFAIPFAGFRISWGLLWPDTMMMLFSLWALYLAAYRGQSWGAVFWICVLAGLASLNTAAGCLGGFMVGALTAFRATLSRRVTDQDKVVMIVCFAIFFFQLLSLPATHSAGIRDAITAFFKALAWPVVFLPGMGVMTLAPLAGLVVAQIFSPTFRQNHVAYVIGAGGLVVLMAASTGAFRGDNNNLGMPSNRYADIFIMVPLICALALCLLCRNSVGRSRTGWRIFAGLWLGLQVFGFSIHIFYHVLPFMLQENGEWQQASKQVRFRDLVRGSPSVSAADRFHEQVLDWDEAELLYKVAQGKLPMPAMTIPMVTGFSLQPGSRGDYVIGGYDPRYQPRPAQIYWGNPSLMATNKWFLSGPFKPQADYITVDVLVDKKARLTDYSLDGLFLTLVDETTGQRVELLPRLANTFPFVFRDWELVYARVTPGDEYRIESHVIGPLRWLAFGEPFESGRLTPLIIGFGQSGKLLCLCAFGLLTLVLGMDRLGGAPPDKPRG
jgi:hypothetical protein